MYELKEELNIENMIYEIRGKQVMLDSDLAKLYQCKNGTKEINQVVKNNPNKFPERFSFRLDKKESKKLLVKNFDRKIETRGGKYKNPRVFTEQGIAMLATVLKSKVAVETSVRIMDATLKKKYESQYSNVSFISTNVFHDRFIIIDRKILYNSGASFKDLGKKCFYIGKIDDEEILNSILIKIVDLY